MTNRSIFIGYDARETDAFAVCRHSIRKRLSYDIPIYGIVLDDMRARALYKRRTERKDGKLWDVISGAHMATEFAISRFLTLHLAKERGHTGWAVFCDCDFLFFDDASRLFDVLDDRYAVMCCKHEYEPSLGVKMDGQENPAYRRKNWSSLFAINLDHPANEALTLDVINSWPGRDLHAFKWLDNELIGEIPLDWNWLVGVYEYKADPSAVHFTLGVPTMAGYEGSDYAVDYFGELNEWARGYAVSKPTSRKQAP